ncbi:MAG: ABC transporter permease [Gemmatimonadales bacterium]
MRRTFVHAVRSLRRAPGFVALATLSIGVGIGLSTSVYAMIDRLMHPVTPYPNVDQLYRIQGYGYSSRTGPTAGQLLDLLPRGGVFTAATMQSFKRTELADANGIIDERRYDLVAPNFFDVVGVRPRLGRVFRDDERAGQNAIVVSDQFWRSRFRDRREIGDASVRLGDRTYAIIGVMPPRFGITPVPTDAWLPFPSDGAMHDAPYGYLTVRAKLGLSTTDLQESLNSFARTVAKRIGMTSPPIAFRAHPVRPDVLQLSDYHKAMLAAALGILLISCANVAALMLARGLSRERDSALRLSLGATRRIIVADVFAEVAIVTALGCVLGLLAAVWGFSALAAATPPEMAWLGITEPAWSWRVLAGAFGAALASAALAGVLPALQASRVDPAGPLKDSAGTTTGRARMRFRVLVIAELALSMVLLSGASLVTKATARVSHYDFGFNPSGLMQTYVRTGAQRVGAATLRTTDDLSPLIDRIRSVAGVENVASMSVASPDSDLVISEDAAAGAPPLFQRAYQMISPGFVATVGLTIVAGRDVNDGDREAGAVLLDDHAARVLFPRGGAVGRMIKLGDKTSSKPWLRVAGVVRHATFSFHQDPDDHGDPLVFAYLPRDPLGFTQLIVRERAGSGAVSFAIQKRVRDALGSGGQTSISPMLDGYAQVMSGRYFVAAVFALLGAASLVLAAAGLFSVLAFAVGQRMREFAVRIALGAQSGDVLRLVLRDGIELALGGTAFGAIGGMWAGSLLTKVLYDVNPTDVTALVSAELILLTVTILASAVPALRAMRADPVVVLRAS